MEIEIAKALISEMTKQIDLIFGISSAVCGGIIFIWLQITLHNNSFQNTRFVLKGKNILLTAFIFEGLSLCFGYLSRGSVVSLIPAIFKNSNKNIQNWTSIDFDGSLALRLIPLAQFSFFIFGLIAILVLVKKNITLEE